MLVQPDHLFCYFPYLNPLKEGLKENQKKFSSFFMTDENTKMEGLIELTDVCPPKQGITT